MGVDLKAQLQDSFLATRIKMSLKCFLKITQPELQGKTLFTETITKKEEITRNLVSFCFCYYVVVVVVVFISIAYIGPSVTPSDANPGFRIYTLDGDYEGSSNVSQLNCVCFLFSAFYL